MMLTARRFVLASAVVTLLAGASYARGAPAQAWPVTISASQVNPKLPNIGGFLAARVAGKGAQKYLSNPEKAIPLLYATTSGARYERAKFARVRGIKWPYGLTAFRVRLFAGATVVEQLFFFRGGTRRLEYQPDGYGTHIAPTTENGRAVPVPYDLAAGDVTLKVAHPWVSTSLGVDALFFRLIPRSANVRPTTDGGQRNDWDLLKVSADPTLFGKCWQTGPRPVDAGALAKTIRSDPDLGATAPVAVNTRGTEALMMDVVIAAGASIRFCENESGGILSSLLDENADQSFDGKGRATGHASGERMRLYLFDAPTRSSIRVLAVAIVVPKSRFKSVVKAAAPVVDSVEFHVR
jgi:hypothetical protein